MLDWNETIRCECPLVTVIAEIEVHRQPSMYISVIFSILVRLWGDKTGWARDSCGLQAKNIQ